MARRRYVAVLSGAVVLVAAQLAGATGKPVLNLSLKGAVKRAPLSGKVQFGRLTCAPLTGKALQLIWSGSVKSGGKFTDVSGEMQFQKTGRSTFGPHGSATASLVVGGDYPGRLATGVPGGSGTGTVAANRKSGTINVVMVAGKSKVRETGNWSCG